ncbi:MAG: SMP-30/gluconolactonase/LRE family protein [Anaerolineales bacterium]|nr:MAG: SMP-30/gluconolactonase/LRE family protein [Anaerolineales bacterium]
MRMKKIPEDEVQHLTSLGCQLGEGPLWHPIEQRLYCVDIESRSIWRIDPESGQAQDYVVDTRVGCLGIRRQGGFVLAGEDGFATWDPDTNEISLITNPEADRIYARYNDGAVDPAGRFWAGTMTPQGYHSSLYRLDPDFLVHRMETEIGISNGIGWSPDQKTMYFTDSPRKLIYAYDFDVPSGEISHRRIWVDSSEEDGLPDGLCVDAEGCVWSARWDGWRISRYDPQGQLMRRIPMPVQRPTSCAFGSPQLKTLFITSAWTGLTHAERSAQPMAGDLFYIELDTAGQTATFFQG